MINKILCWQSAVHNQCSFVSGRFQEIAGSFETALEMPFNTASGMLSILILLLNVFQNLNLYKK